MIDSHCHLDHEPLNSNLKEVLERSKKNGVEKILTICTTIQGYQNIMSLIEKDEMIYGTFGIHPHETKDNKVNKNQIVEKINLNKKIIGVGETGLDFYYNNSDRDVQIKSFQSHIEASIELNVPLIVHSRAAEHETYEILYKNKCDRLKILMHCFTGSSEFADNLLKIGAVFSASGIITFKNSLELQNTFKMIPLDNLLVETDSPFLAPIPMRGKKNEPSFVRYTLDKLSNLKNISAEELDKITTKNFNKLFFNEG